MATLKTYDLKGNKQSYANWISNLSPTETPFSSMIKKEKVDQAQYSWQVDRLSAPSNTAFQEGSTFVFAARTGTEVKTNFTQIFRQVVKVSDTTKKIGLYGRASELAYQMEKKSREMKRDLEVTMFENGVGNIGTSAAASKFTGVFELIAAKGAEDADTKAVVHKEHTYAKDGPATFGIEQIFDLTYNLYLAGAKADKIMVHPGHMAVFSNLVGFTTTLHTHRLFDNVDTKFNMHVGKLRDPLGQEFTIIPNRFMPVDKVLIFNENDWTQMVLREPTRVELAKTGSAEKHMIEMEVGLRHRNPFASAVLVLKEAVSALPYAEEEKVVVKAKAAKGAKAE